jgi:hypothetical protein
VRVRIGFGHITVFTGIERAASACMGEGQIWDISGKQNPETMQRLLHSNPQTQDAVLR